MPLDKGPNGRWLMNASQAAQCAVGMAQGDEGMNNRGETQAVAQRMRGNSGQYERMDGQIERGSEGQKALLRRVKASDLMIELMLP